MLIGAIEYAVTELASQPHALAPQVRSRAEDLIVARLRRVLQSASPAPTEHSSGACRRRLGVERAREYIQKNLSDPIRLSELCHCAHVQGRSLEYGFRETVGMPPVSYVKMLRLGDVHRRLCSPDFQHLTISEIALDAGFRHLSQFSAEYKRLFAESPSETRMRFACPVGRPSVHLGVPAVTLRSPRQYVQRGIESQAASEGCAARQTTIAPPINAFATNSRMMRTRYLTV